MRRQSRNLYSQCASLIPMKKPREQWKFRNSCLHMAKINTYNCLSIHTHPIYFSVEHYIGHIKNGQKPAVAWFPCAALSFSVTGAIYCLSFLISSWIFRICSSTFLSIWICSLMSKAGRKLSAIRSTLIYEAWILYFPAYFLQVLRPRHAGFRMSGSCKNTVSEKQTVQLFYQRRNLMSKHRTDDSDLLCLIDRLLIVNGLCNTDRFLLELFGCIQAVSRCRKIKYHVSFTFLPADWKNHRLCYNLFWRFINPFRF